MKYKRLTNNNREEYNPEYDFCCDCKYYGEPNGCNRWNGECANYERFMEMYDRLAELEDKIDDGRLVELPCKVGDPAWYVIAKGEYSTLVSTNVSEIRIVGRGEYIIYLQGTVRKIYLDNSGRNDNAFLFKEAAEAKLKELRGE